MTIKHFKVIFICLAIISVIGSVVVNLVYDSIIVVPQKEEVTDVFGNKKEFTTLEYSPVINTPRSLESSSIPWELPF